MDNCFVLETKFWTSQPITPENEGGDNTNYPSPPNVKFFDDPEVPWVQYTRIRNLHRPSLNLFQFPCVMAKTMTISHHRERDKDNGLDRVSEYIVTYKCRKNHKFNLWLLQNLMIEISVQDSHDDDSLITINWTTTIS